MEPTKTIGVSIMSLRITCEDVWLENYIAKHGFGVNTSPNYLALKGNFVPLKEWFAYRKLSWENRMGDMLRVLESLVKEGQTKPILIYKDGRINNGHKRAAALLFLGKNTIKAQFVPDKYKL